MRGERGVLRASASSQPGSGIGEVRAGDPQLHWHVLVGNRLAGPDGRWSALDGMAILSRSKHAAGAMFQAVLRADDRRLGLQWLAVQDDVAEVAGVPRRVCRWFSKRRIAIEAELGRLGAAGPVAAAAATLATRPSATAIDATTLDDSWQAQAIQLGWGSDDLDRLLAAPHEAETFAAAKLGEPALVDTVITQLLSAEGTFSRHDVVRAAAATLPRSQSNGRWNASPRRCSPPPRLSRSVGQLAESPDGRTDSPPGGCFGSRNVSPPVSLMAGTFSGVSSQPASSKQSSPTDQPSVRIRPRDDDSPARETASRYSSGGPAPGRRRRWRPWPMRTDGPAGRSSVSLPRPGQRGSWRTAPPSPRTPCLVSPTASVVTVSPLAASWLSMRQGWPGPTTSPSSSTRPAEREPSQCSWATRASSRRSAQAAGYPPPQRPQAGASECSAMSVPALARLSRCPQAPHSDAAGPAAVPPPSRGGDAEDGSCKRPTELPPRATLNGCASSRSGCGH